MEVEATWESESTKQPSAFAAARVLLPLHCLHGESRAVLHLANLANLAHSKMLYNCPGILAGVSHRF